VFRYQNIENIVIRRDEWMWNGFNHENFNELLKTLPIKKLKFVGVGTESYFDSDNFPYSVAKLDTNSITFHWYVGISLTGRTTFLKSQLDKLRELTIHKLPYDFDGGSVLKYIFDNMKLDTFYYKKTALILNGEKQPIKHIDGNEIQITSIYEMFRQFSTIEHLTLNLSNTDISSSDIENIINVRTSLFDSVKHFELVDNSEPFGLFGVFLGLFKNMKNVTRISFKTTDRNISTILAECLHLMPQLNEISIDNGITSRIPTRMLDIIRRNVPSLTKISVDKSLVEFASEMFGNEVEICAILE
jgi:hypothetical protein